MLKTFVSAKIHHIHVTQKSVVYHGSVAIAHDLMRAAEIEPYEQVHVVNLSNGARWVTYALPAARGVFSLNGGGARLGELGDACVIMTYRHAERFDGAHVVYCDTENAIERLLHYPEPFDAACAEPSLHVCAQHGVAQCHECAAESSAESSAERTAQRSSALR